MPWYVVLLIVLAIVTVPVILGNYLGRKLRMPDHGWKISLIIFSLACGIALVPPIGNNPKLGVDLSGGVILVYEVDQSKKTPGDPPVDMDKLIAAVARRVNPGGVKEVTIREYGAEQIEIIIPEVDIEEVKRIEKLVSRAGTLEFRILASSRNDADAIKRAKIESGRVVKDAGGQVVGWWVLVQPGEENSFAGYTEITVRQKKRGDREITEIFVLSDPFNVTGGRLERAVPGFDERGQDCVNFRFSAAGGKLFAHLTSNNLPDPVQPEYTRKLGIILDGYLYSAPAIKSTIHRDGEITGSFTKQEVEDLVNVLNAGSLPTALSEEPISRLQTGATLGQDTIDKGKAAIVASMILVLLFMLFYYRFAGIVACGALLTNLLLIVAIMIMIKAAFTLPGLAGLVLTVGMAVDANVLVFERIREELARGAALRMAIRNGFSRATTTVVDANLTTLITATVLFAIGTDQIKGFAVTLWLGVVLSMYTAIFCSRVVFDIAEKRQWITELKMLRILGGTRIDFLGKRRVAAAISFAVIVIGLVAVGARGGGLLDIDFTGGVRVEVLFKPDLQEKVTVGVLRDKLGDLPDLVVSNVQISDEAPGRRFMVDTSQRKELDENDPDKVKRPAVKVVEDLIHDTFPNELATNSLTIDKLEPVKQKTATAEAEKPAAPVGAGQTRNDLPEDSVLAMADAAPTPLTQADSPDGDAAPEETSEETSEETPEDPPKETPEETPKETPEEAADETPAKPDASGGPEEPVTPPSEPEPAPPPSKPTKPATKPTAPSEPAPESPKPAEPAKSTEPGAESPTPTPPEQPPEPTAADPFAGGTAVTLTFARKVSKDTLAEMFLAEFGSEDAVPTFEASSPDPDYEEEDDKAYETWDVRIEFPPEEARPRVESIQKRVADTPYFPSSNTIGGKVAGSTRTLAVAALLTSLLGIVGYIWIRFQRVVFGLAAVVALVHDVLVTLGVIALSFYLAKMPGVTELLLIDPFKIGLPALAAFLTIIGYSLNDTIVVFDRIREVRGKAPRLTEEMVNTSINQTLARTLLTSLTTLLVVVILYAFGGQGIHGFAFALVVGVLVGTYSSIFVASPALLWMSRPPQGK